MSEEKISEDYTNPQHYKFSNFESFDIAVEIAAECEMNSTEAVLFFNTFKYLTRFKRKEGIKDLKKANWYLNKLVEYESDE